MPPSHLFSQVKLFIIPIVFVLSLVLIYFIVFPQTQAAVFNCCNHECNITDPPKCNGNIVQTCGNCDADPYYDWCDTTDCSSLGQICVQGACQAPFAVCSDGTPTSQCSVNTGAPWYCNGAGNLIESCTLCGCTGSWKCSSVGTFCCDNECNGVCSVSGCTASDDPDCGLNGCCGDGNCKPDECSTCPNDCSVSDCCGNNACDLNIGENNSNCAADCPIMCSPDGCNGNCPANCVASDDPDCGCVDNNNCCGQGCDSVNDNDCVCTENWTCTNWSVCANDKQTRICTDSNSCGTMDNKPDEEQLCLSVNIDNPGDGENYVQGDFIDFNATLIGGVPPYNFNWNSNINGDFSTDQTFLVDSSSWLVGQHIITVTVTDSNGQVGTDNIKININSAGTLIANIQMWQTEFVRDPNQPSIFAVDVQGGTQPYTFQWNSDKQGNFSTEQWPSVDVSDWDLGTHHITVTVTDSVGAVVTDTIDVKIMDMMVDIVNPLNGQNFVSSEEVWFMAMVQGGTPPYNYQWTSNKDGDITPDTEFKETFQKNNLSEGLHTIILTVSDSSPIPITASQQIYVVINDAPNLFVDISSPNNSTFNQGDDILFQANIDGGVPPYTYNWSSNLEGQIGVDQNFNKNNLSVGNHVVTLTVNDNSGQTVSKTINLTIAPPTQITVDIIQPDTENNFYVEDSIICFSANIEGGVAPYIYQWNSNIDGNISNKDKFCTTKLSSGNHNVTLNITDQNNNSQSSTISFTINSELNFINTKNTAKYLNKETFLISDKNWQDVLSLIPITVWQENIYPLLVYHEEEDNIDIDSAIHFLQMYKPDHLTTVGEVHWRVNPLLVGLQPSGANLEENSISNINPSDYFSYWNTVNSLVVVDYNDYQAGLMASVFASYKNAPIIFINNSNLENYKSLINNKIIYVVNNLEEVVNSYIKDNAGTVIHYSLRDLQKLYIQKTNTNKIIFVNPDDLNNDYEQPGPEPNQYETDKGGTIYTLLNKLSLASPYLAAAKQEVILFYNSQNVDLFDLYSSFNNSMPLYGTIMASKDMVININTPDMYGFDYYYGIIPGISSTDTFSYSARSIFYNELFNLLYPPSDYSKFYISADLTCAPTSVRETNNNSVFIDSPYNPANYAFDVLKNKQFNVYHSHGNYFCWACSVFKDGYLFYSDIPYLDLSWGSAGSCLTGVFHGAVSFSYNWLRKGGMAYWGASKTINIGESSYGDIKPFEEMRNDPNIDLGHLAKKVGGPYIMYGDPTLSLIFRGGNNVLPHITLIVNETETGEASQITVDSGDVVQMWCSGWDVDGDITTWELDFDGDGVYDQVVNSGEKVNYTYFESGIFYPHCRATDNNGGQAVTFAIINVN